MTALSRYLAHRRQKQQKPTHSATGRVTMRKLQQQYGDLRSVTIDDANTRQFERIARKYRVQYKVYRCQKGKYQIFFKAPNDEAMQTAFQEYAKGKIRKAERPSVLKQLQALKAQIKAPADKHRHQELER
jgi:choline dehydrogenase-like flavoprotein